MAINSFSNVNIMAISINENQGGGQYGGYGQQDPCGQVPHHHHHHRHCEEGGEGGEGPEAPKRNQFLDFLTAPMQALKGGGNNNDKQYDKYLGAAQGGNLLKGF